MSVNDKHKGKRVEHQEPTGWGMQEKARRRLSGEEIVGMFRIMRLDLFADYVRKTLKTMRTQQDKDHLLLWAAKHFIDPDQTLIMDDEPKPTRRNKREC